MEQSSDHARTKQEPLSPELRKKMASVKRSLRFQDDDEKLGVNHDVDVSFDGEMPRKNIYFDSYHRLLNLHKQHLLLSIMIMRAMTMRVMQVMIMKVMIFPV